VTIFITTFLSLLLYENVIIKEADKFRKNLEKLINENYKLTKGYQYKLKRGFFIIRTLVNLRYSTLKNKNKKINNSDLQNLLNSSWLPIQSPNRKNNNHIDYFFKKDIKNKNLNIKNNKEDFYNKNNISNIDESKVITQRIDIHDSNILEISTSRNLIFKNQKKIKKRNNFIKSNFVDIGPLADHSSFKKLDIINAANFQYLKNENNNLSETGKIIKYFYTGKRKFTFPGKFMNISCSEVFIIKNPEMLIPKYYKKDYLKIYLIFIIYVVIFFYLMILIQNIQTKYGNKFIEICVLPFFTTLLVKFMFTFNFMMLITSFLLYYFGDHFVNKKKLPLHLFIVSKVFISPVVMNHYYAIKLYQHFN